MRCLLPVLVLVAGCSLVVNPDRDELANGPGTEFDASTVDASDVDASADGSVTPPSDSGVSPSPDLGVDAAIDLGVDLSMSCTGATRCEGNELIECPVSGVETRTFCPSECREGRCLELVPSHLSETPPLARFALNITSDATFSTDECEMDADDVARTTPLSDGTVVCLVTAEGFTLASGVRLLVRGSRPLVIVANDVSIAGTLDASAHHAVPGPGGFRGGIMTDEGKDGAGDNGGFAGEHVDLYDDGGGGGGGFGGNGGSGGSANMGRRGFVAIGGTGGAAVARRFALLRGGAGGGRGRGTITVDRVNAGYGGAGGGGVQISALRSFVLTGTIAAGGGGGGGGLNSGALTSNYGSGGGGGTGGVVWLEAPSIDASGAAAIVVAGGGGGGASNRDLDGQDGGDGFPSPVSPLVGEVASAGGMGIVAGGRGASGAVANGDNGSNNEAQNSNGGGGGGSAGVVALRTASGSASGIAVRPAAASVLDVQRATIR
jgi:hypothetical protein